MTESAHSDFSDDALNWEAWNMSERLRTAIQMGGGYNTVVLRSGISASALNNYLKGREMKISTAMRLAAACGVRFEWLAAGAGSPTTASSDISPLEDHLTVPFYDAELAAGSGRIAAHERPVSSVSVGKSMVPASVWIARDRLVALMVRGDSMEPTLHGGDLVFVVQDKERLVPGAIYAIRTGDHLQVKRLEQRINGDLVVMSDNKRYSDQIFDAEQARQLWADGDAPARIIGRVVWRSGSTDS